jgi:integrase
MGGDVAAVKHTLDDLITAWCRSQESQGLARNTVRNRELHLRALMALVGNIQINNLERRHVDGYFTHCMTKPRPLQPLSLNKHKESLDAFFVWAVANRYLAADRNPMAGRRKFKAVPKDRLLIPASDFPRLLDSAPHPRDRIVVALGLYLFPRQSEIRSMRIKDVDLERGYVHMKNHKSSSADDMPSAWSWTRRSDVAEVLRRASAAAPGLPLRAGQALPPRRRAAEPGQRRQVQLVTELIPNRPMGEMHDAVQRTLEAAGYQIKDENGRSNYEGSHTLRRSGARALYDRLLDDGHDGAIRVVQAMLHHSSVSMTEHYLGMKLDQARRDKLLKGQRMFAAPSENVVLVLSTRWAIAEAVVEELRKAGLLRGED